MVWRRETLEEIGRQRMILGEEEGAPPPLSHCPLGRGTQWEGLLGSMKGPGCRNLDPSQRPYVEVRVLWGHCALGPHISSLGSVPRPRCQHLRPEPAPGKRSHEIMGRGKLAGPRSLLEPQQVHGRAQAWRLCNLPPGRFQRGSSSNQPV